MNYSTAIFLVNKDVRAVSVSYELKPGTTTNEGLRPFFTYKTMNPDVKPGDYVVIPTDTRHGRTVCRVEEVDVEIDFDSAVQIAWLIDRVDTETHNAIVAVENDAIAKIRSAEKRRKQEELQAKLIADNPELANLAGVNSVSALPAPPAGE